MAGESMHRGMMDDALLGALRLVRTVVRSSVAVENNMEYYQRSSTYI